ncbi:HNH endonuclease [Bisgaard Taxon 45]
MLENLVNAFKQNYSEDIQLKEKIDGGNPLKLSDIKDLPTIDSDKIKYPSLSLPDIKELPPIKIWGGIKEKEIVQEISPKKTIGIQELNKDTVFIERNEEQISYEEYSHKNNIEPKTDQPTDQKANSSVENESIEETKENPEETTKTPCRNEHLAGQEHPITGVQFQEKTVVNKEGEKVVGVFPIFESICDVQIPEDMHQASDKEQFAECNAQLKEKVNEDPELRGKFTEEQLEQIENGDTPDGYTWHHNEETGKMQLVDSSIHAKTGHTGGKAIWGGGSENR